MEDRNSRVSFTCNSCGLKLTVTQAQDFKPICESCQARIVVEAEVLNSNGSRVLIKCGKCGKPMSAVASSRGSNSVWCNSCVSDFQTGESVIPSKFQNQAEMIKIDVPKRKDLEASKAFIRVMGIGWTFAFINTLATANKAGGISPESLGGGIGGFALYLLFAGIIWNVIIGILWGLLKLIVSAFQRKR